jgi:hypothetical protein
MSNDLVRTREIINTTNSIGWSYIKDLAEGTVTSLERLAIDEDDDDKGATLRREAKAARKFLNSFLRAVESMRDATVPHEDAPGPYFYDVAD